MGVNARAIRSRARRSSSGWRPSSAPTRLPKARSNGAGADRSAAAAWSAVDGGAVLTGEQVPVLEVVAPR